MNIQQLRQSLKQKWLSYYEQNCPWLVKMQIWGTYDGLRRPSSGFILATLSVLEPQFDQILSFIMDLNNNPDKIVVALGLNFDPAKELGLIKSEHSTQTNQVEKESVPEKPYASVAPPVKVTPQFPVKVLHSPKPSNGLSHAPSKITSNAPVKIPHSSLLREQQQVRSLLITTELPSKVEDNGKKMRSLVITTEIPAKVQTLPSPALTNEISRNGKHANVQLKDISHKLHLLSSTNENSQPTLKIPRMGETLVPQNHPKIIQHPTNARSLASWVDEFCHGTELHREEDIFI
ncbi:MAG: DUF5331 domain-containing protein [Desmonostoc vinosum HA7617-LM4]|jgi:hypothetical protein|nr:DUF5331 domain-containing protein [Desmonostoc vinosum HA7617-LM4]